MVLSPRRLVPQQLTLAPTVVLAARRDAVTFTVLRVLSLPRASRPFNVRPRLLPNDQIMLSPTRDAPAADNEHDNDNISVHDSMPGLLDVSDSEESTLSASSPMAQLLTGG